MVSRLQAAAIAGCVMLGLAGAPARAQGAPDPRFAFVFPDTPSALVRPVLPKGDPDEWTKGGDYPPGVIPAVRGGKLRLQVMVSAADAITGCTGAEPGADPKLVALACRLVRARGGFLHALARDGKPAGGSAELLFHFTPPLSIPVAPSFSRYAPDWVLQVPPQWTAFAPPGNPSGDVGAEMGFATINDDPMALRACSIRRSSGNAALDAATCAALTSASYVQRPRNSTHSNSIAIMVHWRDGVARWETVEEDQSRRLEVHNREALAAFAPPPDFYDTGFGSASVSPDGSIGCVIGRSSGSDAADLAFCTTVETALRFTGALDLFGLPVAAKTGFPFVAPHQP